MSAGLEQRVTALEKAIAGLQGSEALTPSYLTLSPSGQVGAVFPGGVQMVEETSETYGPTTALGWLDSGGSGDIREAIFGYFLSLGSVHKLIATAGSETVQLINSDGTSSFIQQADGATEQVAIGFGAGTVVGSGPRLGVNIGHGLGRTPTFWAVVPDDFEGVIRDASAPDSTNIYAELDIFTVPASGNVTVNTGAGGWSYKWVAIG